MKGVISLKSCFEKMYDGEVFSFRCVSYDRKRPKKSGKIIEYQEAKLLWVQAEIPKIDTKLRDVVAEVIGDKNEAAQIESLRINPHHRDNYTLNVRIHAAGQPTPKIVKIHPILLLLFNAQKVVL